VIQFYTIDGRGNIPQKKNIRRTLSWLVKKNTKSIGEISVFLCSDETILRMNKEHLNHDYYTDILTFDHCTGQLVSGELYISADRIRENAAMFHVKREEELFRVIFHGVLHLLGHKDKTGKEKEQMRAKEDKVLHYLRSLS
jgi:rRNA maturation RNase YbeY